MAGAALTTPIVVTNIQDIFVQNALVKNAEVVNFGDLGAIDTGGFIVVASKTQGATVKAQGVIVFSDENGTAVTRTGDGTTVRASLAKKARISNINSTKVPGLDEGLPVYLGPVTTTTVTNYTCTQTTTVSDLVQCVGFANSDQTALDIHVAPESTVIAYSTAGALKIAT